MRPQFSLYLLALVARTIVAQVAFVYPPAFEATPGFSDNIVMVEGEFKVIQWANVDNPNNARISVTMFQLNGTQFFGGAEYITQNAAPDTLSTPWTVNTNKNLTISPMFYLNLFLEGETASLTNSHYFNITRKSTTTSSSSTTSTTSSTRSSSTRSTTSSQTSTSPTSVTTTPPATTSPVAAPSSGLSPEATAGIAVGVIGAAALGVLAGWLLLGRRRRELAAPENPLVQTSYYDPMKMAQQYPHEVSGEPAPPIWYELPPDRQQS